MLAIRKILEGKPRKKDYCIAIKEIDKWIAIEKKIIQSYKSGCKSTLDFVHNILCCKNSEQLEFELNTMQACRKIIIRKKRKAKLKHKHK